jgi:ThiF family
MSMVTRSPATPLGRIWSGDAACSEELHAACWCIVMHIALEDPNISIRAGPTGTETLKNLVLGGIAAFTVVDGGIAEPADLGNNFMMEAYAVGQPRAPAVTAALKACCCAMHCWSHHPPQFAVCCNQLAVHMHVGQQNSSLVCHTSAGAERECDGKLCGGGPRRAAECQAGLLPHLHAGHCHAGWLNQLVFDSRHR